MTSRSASASSSSPRLAVEAIGDASSPPALDEDARDERLGDDRQIRTAARRPEVAVGDAEPPPAPLRDRHEAHAGVVGAVQVVARGNPARLRSVDEGLGEHVRVALLRERERAVGAPPKRGLRLRPRPPGTSVRLPARSRRDGRAGPSSRSSPPSRRAPDRGERRSPARRAPRCGTVESPQSSVCGRASRRRPGS